MLRPLSLPKLKDSLSAKRNIPTVPKNSVITHFVT